ALLRNGQSPHTNASDLLASADTGFSALTNIQVCAMSPVLRLDDPLTSPVIRQTMYSFSKTTYPFPLFCFTPRYPRAGIVRITAGGREGVVWGCPGVSSSTSRCPFARLKGNFSKSFWLRFGSPNHPKCNSLRHNEGELVGQQGPTRSVGPIAAFSLP